MIIDGHAHASREFASIETLVPLLDSAGVDKVALCPSLKNNLTLGPPPKIFNNSAKERTIEKVYALNKFITLTYKCMPMNGDPNAYVYSLKEQAPTRIEQFYWVDIRSADAVAAMESDFRKWHFSGIKLHQGWNPYPFTGENMQNLLDMAAVHNLPLFIHPGKKRETERLLELVRAYPSVPFIVGHLMASELGRHYKGDNLFHDISPTNLKRELVQQAIRHYGAGQILFGSDMPFGDLRTNLTKVDALPISSDTKDAILGKNMEAILDNVCP